jgi:uncharacterized membrane protein
VRLLLIIFLIPLLTYAGNEDELECRAYYGLNVCASTLELTDDQISYSEQDKNSFDTIMEEHSPLFSSLADEDINQIQKENAFENTDSFRAYMKSLENPDGAGNNSGFSLKKRILKSTYFGLDCRVVANSIYEISNNNYYDCALQRNF